MPIYEYECKTCDEIFEVMQKISDAPLKKCKLCASEDIKKLISNTSFSLKGSGWYADGYGTSSANKSTKKSSSNNTSVPSKATSTSSSNASSTSA